MTDDLPATRPGRWRSGAQSRQRVLDAARTLFAARGYSGTTVRAVAANAGVDPAMVYYFFGTKQGLFSAALEMSPQVAPALHAVFAGSLDSMGVRIIRTLLEAMDASDHVPLAILTRTAPHHDESEVLLREFIDRELTDRLMAMLDAPDAAMRVGTVNAFILGVAVARYVVRMEPVASASVDELVARIGPTLQQCLTGPTA
ncbi:TetR/AcrR family transcriptional regulator [Fodinicola feengrottensis]|uniref:TetR family transcriptional regulator n=1 Tax=Fodinicola feengrottensis TaxID=435914 RepID=A0ABN2FTK4_9ACTN|nr:TetR family transcriptional regulator [Fodinicola feengrottensis]